jgi:anti-anti-sigma factor
MSTEAGDGSRRVITLTGRLDVTTSPEVEAELLGTIAAGGHHLVLDVSGLEYASSAGIRVLIIAGKEARDAGGELVFAAPNPHIRQILEISGFRKLFRIVATVGEAFPAE